MLKLRKTRRALAMTAATLALAGGASLTATSTAHADTNGWVCPATNNYYARWHAYGCLDVSGGRGYVYISAYSGTNPTTDVRYFFELYDNCYGSWHLEATDSGNSGILLYPGRAIPSDSSSTAWCPGPVSFQIHTWITDSGSNVSDAWSYVYS